jgi:hypothetical protein
MFPIRAPEFTRFATFATRCVKEGAEMPGLLETGQRVKMRFCMTSFFCLSGTLRISGSQYAIIGSMKPDWGGKKC